MHWRQGSYNDDMMRPEVGGVGGGGESWRLSHTCNDPQGHCHGGLGVESQWREKALLQEPGPSRDACDRSHGMVHPATLYRIPVPGKATGLKQYIIQLVQIGLEKQWSCRYATPVE